MARFLDLIAALSEMEEKPDSMLDDLLAAYDADVSEYSSQIDSITSAGESALAEANSVIAALKSQNYDLLMSVTASDNAGGGASGESEDSFENSNIMPEDLFGESEDE